MVSDAAWSDRLQPQALFQGAALALDGLAIIARGRAGDLGVEEGVAHDGAPTTTDRKSVV